MKLSFLILIITLMGYCASKDIEEENLNQIPNLKENIK